MALRARKVSGAFEKRAPGVLFLQGINLFGGKIDLKTVSEPFIFKKFRCEDSFYPQTLSLQYQDPKMFKSRE